MRKFATHTIGVDQGDTVIFSDFEDGGEMWTGEGPRLTRHPIVFAESFDVAPVITVGLSMYDVAEGANIRMDVRAEGATREGFDIVFRTWGDTRIARARVAWMAIGALADDESWDL